MCSRCCFAGAAAHVVRVVIAVITMHYHYGYVTITALVVFMLLIMKLSIHNINYLINNLRIETIILLVYFFFEI